MKRRLRKRYDIHVLLSQDSSSSLNKGNHDRDGVWISDLNQHRFL